MRQFEPIRTLNLGVEKECFMSSRLTRASAASALIVGAVAIACTGTLDVPSNSSTPPGGETPDGGPELPFEPVQARVYVAKVKNLMLGLPATEEEIAAVTSDPAALRGLVDAWFVRPEAQAKLGNFFNKAFQQTQISQNDFFDQLSVDNLTGLSVFAQAQESMSRTALKTIADGKPFTDTVTTHTFMMTPALMSMYLAIDQSQVDDVGKVSVSVPMPDGTLSTTQAFWLTYQADTPIPLTETIDPASPNFMHFAVAAPFSCSVPALDATGHVVVDAMGKATKVDVKYNQRKYSSVTSAFLGLFGWAQSKYTSDPSDPNGPPIITIPADVPADQKFLQAASLSHRPTRLLKTRSGARSRCGWPRPARSSRRFTIFPCCARRTKSSCACRVSATSRPLRSSPIGRRTTATSIATRSTKR
jgi:hypothetical protein